MTTELRTGLSRRTLLRLSASAGVTAALAATGCNRFGGGGPATSAGEINFVWWGDAARAASTQALLDLYTKENPGTTLRTEYQDSGPYADKLATRFAAGDVPDLFAQRRDSLREYADRGALLDLREHLDLLALDGVPETIQQIGVVGESMYGIPAGLNAVGFVINTTLAEKFGVSIPDGDTWSWDDYFAMAAAITKASGKKVYGGDLDFGTLQNVVVFVRQTGEELYNPDDTLGVSTKTMTDWFSLSVDQRRTGALPPAGFVEALGGGAEQSYLAKGTIASQVIPTNNLKAYNKAAGGKLQLNRMPGEVQGKRRGMSIDTAMYWSVGSKSKNIDGGLKLLDFITNSIEGNKAVGPTRGVPASTVVAEAIADSLDPDDKTSVDYITGLSKEQLPESRPDPIGGSEIADLIANLATEVMFERVAPAEAAKQFTDGAAKILKADNS
ncbi:ABC transporter substrate-binding protein [Microlunatus parietis]|uniref:Multiple sugar transport system substrate-binding protein n=1 Tax=Microlunatus parietis TaxID=682979 RepID=A0A7Y9LAB6_9ACTN|nr:ABC transporter substrate-binding protein [Microlunatus parietis]NYE69598.1 multiple sugar transport system substrate-binding protein [Microlunatus parietis]